MHNVLSLANCRKTSQDVAWRFSCFDTLFLHGFWKKLVFLLDSDSSLQLSYSVRDFSSFKLNYLVHKLAITDPKIISKALASPKDFSDIVHKKKDDQGDSFWVAKQIIEEHEISSIFENYLL